MFTAWLRKADCWGANFKGVDLESADLVEAQLQEACLVGVSLLASNIEKADLRGADLSGADLADADLAGSLHDPAQWLVTRGLRPEVEWFGVPVETWDRILPADPAARSLLDVLLQDWEGTLGEAIAAVETMRAA